MAAGPIAERNQDATIYVGNLDDKVTETLMWELFVQSGPVVNVHMPKDRVTQMHQGYGFVEFLGEEDADYAIKIMNMIKLYGKPIHVNKASAHQKNLDVGANVFIGNLDTEVDEKLLYDTFSAFGVILQTPKIMRDTETGNSKCFGFINFASFDASDAAIDAMNGQHLCNRPITVSYAFKKEAKGERHGSAAERLLAAQNPLSQANRPHQLFADSPSIGSSHIMPPHLGVMPPMMPPPPPSTPGMHPPPPPPVPPPNMVQNMSVPPGTLSANMPPPTMGNMQPQTMGNHGPPPPRMMPPPWQGGPPGPPGPPGGPYHPPPPPGHYGGGGFGGRPPPPNWRPPPPGFRPPPPPGFRPPPPPPGNSYPPPPNYNNENYNNY